MYCRICGTKLKEGTKFCNECGTKINTKSTSKPVTSNTDNVNTSSSVNVTPINKNKAIASLVLGILSFQFGVLFIPLPIIGLILGIKQKEKCGEKTAGIILNSIALGLSVITLVFMGIFIAIGIAADDTEYDSRNHYYNNDEIIEDDYNDYEDIFEY